MGTRGAFGVIIGEQEKIAYNQYDSYPEGKGVEVLRWLRDADLEVVRVLAEKAKVVDEDSRPTPEDVEALKPYTNLGVSEQSTEDWYCLVRETQGDLGEIFRTTAIPPPSRPRPSSSRPWPSTGSTTSRPRTREVTTRAASMRSMG